MSKIMNDNFKINVGNPIDGIDTARVMAVGYGETKPVASNETPEGRRKNRRIDIVIYPKKD